MIIRELYIKNFGKISERRYCFREGINIISGENEFGKSTIHSFIRAMLFGLERGRGRAAARDEFTRYEPWDDPGHYAGIMWFSCGERNFRLERTFDRHTKKAVLVCEDDGEELSVEQGDLDMLLGGLTPGLFDSTVSVAQLRAEPGKELAEALDSYAANYFATGGGEVDLSKAFQILRDRKKETLGAIRAEEKNLTARNEKLAQECAYLQREMDELQNEFEEKSHLLEIEETQQKERQKEPDSSIREEDTEEEQISVRGLALTGAAGLAAGAAGLIWSRIAGGGQIIPAGPLAFIAVLILIVGAALCAGAVYLAVKGRDAKKISDHTGEAEKNRTDSLRNRPEENVEKQESGRLKWELERIKGEWKEKEIRCENLREQSEEWSKSDAQISLEERYRALELAEQELEAAVRETGTDTVRHTGKMASDILEYITDGKYRKMDFDKKEGISVWDGTHRVRAERLSRGTLEQIYFALRMAAAQTVLEEPMPVILDDTFAFYDDKRLKCALKWLSRQEKQAIIFTCHRREEEILEKEVIS